MINFDPSRIEAKCEGRRILAQVAGIDPEVAALYFIDATHNNFQDSFNSFISAFPKEAKAISDYRPDGIGPGEMVAWFIFNNITLGGKNSNVDLLIDGEPFGEMKAGRITQKSNSLDNFKIAKDTDPCVSLILSDLEKFNATYKQIVGYDLPGWTGISSIKVSALAMWVSIDLVVLQRIVPPPAIRRYIPIDPDGSILSFSEEGPIASIHDSDLQEKLREELAKSAVVVVDRKISTLKKIVARWKLQVFEDYVWGKTFILMDASTLEVKHLGSVRGEMLGLYCIHRNQPWARIHLNKC